MSRSSSAEPGPQRIGRFRVFRDCGPGSDNGYEENVCVRASGMRWTDKRAKLLQELLGGMKVVKFFAWETPFAKRIWEFRQKEMS